MLFALLEIKLTLVKVLRKLNVCPRRNTPEKLRFTEGSVPMDGVHVLFEKRQLNFYSKNYKSKNFNLGFRKFVPI